jgi:hypothetical protein
MAISDDKYQITPNGSQSKTQDATDFANRQGTTIGNAVTTGMNQKTADNVKDIMSGQGSVFSVGIKKGNHPLADRDAAGIIAAYEGESVYMDGEEAALVTHYKDVHSTEAFSRRVQEQMGYYPGIHNSQGTTSETNPFNRNAEQMAEQRLNKWDNAMDSPDSFMGALRNNVPVDKNGNQAFDYDKIFGTEGSAKDRATEMGKMLTACIPCFDRLLDLDGLVPDGDLLEVHGLNVKLRLDFLDKIMDLFKNPGSLVDICELLKLLSGLCPTDLIAILSLLTQYLAKLNLDFKFNLDFILNLIGPILSPFLNALSQWLDKWVQLILAPVLCVTDHINEVIYMLNTAKIAAKSASFDVNGESNINLLGITGLSGAGSTIDTGFSMQGDTWTESEAYRFDKVTDKNYTEYKPEIPKEEIDASWEETLTTWGEKTPTERTEAEERKKQFEELRREREEQSRNLQELPGYRKELISDGSRWSNDGTPLSEKTKLGSFSKGMENHPPEKQVRPLEGPKYFDPSPLVSSIVQLRNIVQSAIRYVQDWFNYAIQMMYDLLGVDFGWLSKKSDASFLKSQVIQMILLIKSLLQSVSKNGLKCGLHSNFDVLQMKHVLENGFNQFSSGYKFKVRDNGDIEVLPPGVNATLPSVEDVSSVLNQKQADKDAGAQRTEDKNSPQVKLNEQTRQKTQESGIIVKNCLRDMSKEEVEQARQWISDYERRLGQNA